MSSSPRDVKGAGRQQQQGRQPGKKVNVEKEKPARAIQTKINLYLSSTKAGKLDGAAEKFTKTTALRRDFPLGVFGSQGSKGALTPSRKPPRVKSPLRAADFVNFSAAPSNFPALVLLR